MAPEPVAASMLQCSVMADRESEDRHGNRVELYCPTCSMEISDPLTCGDCGAVICRRCGTPLEAADELGIG
jgi:hypothetical protein